MGLMKWFKTIFQDNEKPQAPRKVESLKDLQENDIIEFSFFEITNLSGQKVTVIDKNKFESSTIEETSCVFQDLKGQQYIIADVTFNMKSRLAIAKELTRQEVESLFNSDDFAKVFDEGHTKKLIRQGNFLPDLAQWSGDDYYEHIDCIVASKYLEKSGKRLNFDFYRLVTSDEQFGIDIYVLEEGETLVYANRYFETSVIKQLWPV